MAASRNFIEPESKYVILAMNVIRMIKLFGWEPRVNEQLAGKREDELQQYRKYRLLELANGMIKYVVLCRVLLSGF